MKKALAITIILVLLCTGCGAPAQPTEPTQDNGAQYQTGVQLMEQGSYQQAQAVFESLGTYEDAGEKAAECVRRMADDLYAQEDYQAAQNAYLQVGDTEKAKVCEYALACKLLAAEDYAAALEHFSGLSDYEDSQEQAQLCQREIGMHENADYDFLDAIAQSVQGRMGVSTADAMEKEKLVHTELAYLEKFEALPFYDTALKELALAYIQGLRTQEEALKKVQEYEYQIMWQEGVVARYGVLSELYANYGLLADNAEFVGTYVYGYEGAKYLLDGYHAIEEDIAAQLTDPDRDPWSGGYDSVSCTVKNNTSYTYSIGYRFFFYNADGALYESQEQIIRKRSIITRQNNTSRLALSLLVSLSMCLHRRWCLASGIAAAHLPPRA